MKNFKLCVLAFTFLLTCLAQASVIGMLYSGPETNVSFGVERTAKGEMYFLLDIDNNPEKAEYVFSPGNPFNSASVVVLNGKPFIHLSIYHGGKYGFNNSKKVSLVQDSKVNRTSQRSLLSNDFKIMAEQGMLVDKDAKVYSYEELEGVVFVFQIAGRHDSSLSSQLVEFASLKKGELRQLFGTVKLQ